jgi:hypothetical protein
MGDSGFSVAGVGRAAEKERYMSKLKLNSQTRDVTDR